MRLMSFRWSLVAISLLTQVCGSSGLLAQDLESLKKEVVSEVESMSKFTQVMVDSIKIR